MTNHGYTTHTTWSGSTADGIRSYSRNHRISTPPVEVPLELSADPAFRGDADRWNPEQLLVAAAASCQMLSFLAEAARNGVTILGYSDTATSRLLTDIVPARLDIIHLDVTVKVAAGTDHGEVERIAHLAHEQCYIANTLAVDVEVTTHIVEAS